MEPVQRKIGLNRDNKMKQGNVFTINVGIKHNTIMNILLCFTSTYDRSLTAENYRLLQTDILLFINSKVNHGFLVGD